MWARANQSSSLCIWASRPYGGTRRFKTRGPVCWSVLWPGAVEDEGLTRVPSAVCDCAHGGRVVKKSSIAGLFGTRLSRGQTWVPNPFSLETDKWSVQRDALIHDATTELNRGLGAGPNSIDVLSLKLGVSHIRLYPIKSITISWIHTLWEIMFLVPLTRTRLLPATPQCPQPTNINSTDPPFPVQWLIHWGENSAGPFLHSDTFQIMIKISIWPPVQSQFSPSKTFWQKQEETWQSRNVVRYPKWPTNVFLRALLISDTTWHSPCFHSALEHCPKNFLINWINLYTTQQYLLCSAEMRSCRTGQRQPVNICM